jgi:hypothetical protein
LAGSNLITRPLDLCEEPLARIEVLDLGVIGSIFVEDEQVETAVAMIRDLGARIAVAVHGTASNMKAFKSHAGEELPDVDLVLPKPGELVTLRAGRPA